MQSMFWALLSGRRGRHSSPPPPPEDGAQCGHALAPRRSANRSHCAPRTFGKFGGISVRLHRGARAKKEGIKNKTDGGENTKKKIDA